MYPNLIGFCGQHLDQLRQRPYCKTSAVTWETSVNLQC